MFHGIHITWLGHSTFLFETPQGKKILLDPWLASNPKCPKAFHKLEVDAILITHGHQDHIGDVFSAHKRCKGPVVGIFDLTTWLGTKGVPEEKLVGMNKGGRTHLEGLGLEVVMTNAHHSSSFMDDGTLVYLGEPAGFVLKFSEGPTIYVAGDTCVFGDMELIAKMEEPEVAILPIGDFFTMDPRAAAWATRLLGVKQVIPCHYGTFPALKGSPKELRAELRTLGLEVEVVELEPGVKI